MKENSQRTNDQISKAVTHNLGSGKGIFLPGHLQPKLPIGAVSDPLEHDADTVADKVMRMPEPSSQRQTFINPPPSYININVPDIRKEELQRKENEEEQIEKTLPEIQSKFSFDAPPLTHPDDKNENKSSAFVQRKCEAGEQEEKQHYIHRKEGQFKAPKVNSSFENYVNSLGNSGLPLPQETKKFFEPKFGFDFSNVKVHTDSIDAKSADSINAMAYTSGNNIVFNQNQFSPETDSGKRLLAHELSHVVQQSNAHCKSIKNIQRRSPKTEDDDWGVHRDPPKPRTKFPQIKSWTMEVKPGKSAPSIKRKNVNGLQEVFLGDTVVVKAKLKDLKHGEIKTISTSQWEGSAVGSGWTVSDAKRSSDVLSWTIRCGEFRALETVTVGLNIDDSYLIGQISYRAEFKRAFAPELAANPTSVNVDTNNIAKINFEVKNLSEAGTSKLHWLAQSNTPDNVGLNKILNSSNGKASAEITGIGAGTGEIQANLQIIGDKIKEDNYIKVPVTVSSDAARASKKLHGLNEDMSSGKAVDERELLATQNLAMTSSQAIADRAKKNQNTGVTVTIMRILDQIQTIEGAKNDGYIDAVNDLNAKGLDQKASYDSFNQALFGNLLWALSGIIPGLSAVSFATKGLMTFFKVAATDFNTVLSTAIGTAGAMIAQYSSSPSSSRASELKISLKKDLTDTNSYLCNTLRRAAYEYIASAISQVPPDVDADISVYMADIEMGVKRLLYGDIYEKGLNDGELPSAAKVKEDARNQLLRRYIVPFAALSGSDLDTIRGFGERVKVKDAVELLGGLDKLKLGRYELVANQMITVAREMGCKIDKNEDEIAEALERYYDVTASVSYFNRYKIFSGGTPTPWMNLLASEEIVSVNPEFQHEAYLNYRGISDVSTVKISKSDFESTNSNGNTIFSAKKVRFTVHGSDGQAKDFIAVNPPSEFEIIYKIK